MEEEGYQSFVSIVAKEGSDDIMEIPWEKDGTVLLSSVQAQFPNAVGLKYKSSSGGWRGIRAENNILDPPHGGWGDRVYIIAESDALKRRANEHSEYERSHRRTRIAGEDLIVLGIPYETTEDEVRDLLTQNCGDLLRCELKLDYYTHKSKGYCFVQFETEEGARKALKGHHEIGGRRLEIRMSKKRGDVPMKLFLGKLPPGTTEEILDEYFTEYGRLLDVFIPQPFRGCAFITYSAQEDAAKVLRRNHRLLDAYIKITPARPKEGKSLRRQENFGVVTDDVYREQPFFKSERRSRHDGGRSSDSSNRRSRQATPAAPDQKELASTLTDMFLKLIQSQSKK